MIGERTVRRRRGFRTPTVLQLEAAECGAASLAMVLGYHGRFVPLDELRALCGVTRDGAKASSVVRAGRSFGMQARGLKAEPAHLQDLPKPLIAFVDFNHFLVVDDVDADSVWLNDPASGRRRETLKEFSPSFTGVVLTFEPTAEFVRGDSRPALLASLRERFRGLESVIAFCVLVSLLLVVPGLLLPVFARIFVDYVLVRAIDDWLLPIALGMGVTALGRAALELVRGHVLLAARTTMALRTGHRLMARLLKLPVGYFEQRFAGEIADRLRLDEGLAELLTGKLAAALVGLVTAVFLLLAMFVYHPGIATAVFAQALINAGVLWWSTQWLAERYRKVSLDQGKLFGARVAGMKDIETFKASGSEDMLFARWQGLRVAVANGEQAIALAAAWLGPLPALLAALGHAVVLVWGGFAVMAGQLTLGELVALQSLAASFSLPIATLAGFGAELQQIRSYTARLDDVLAHPEDPLASRPELGQDTRLAQGRVGLHGVSFGYAPLDPPLLVDIDLELTPGKRIALVGASGSGKSTLGKLIAGLIAPRAGDYTIDERPLAAHPRAELAARLAYVGQQPRLFEDSVRANLTLWDDAVDDAAVLRAAQDACIHDVVASRAGGYAAAVAEGGANFSGGERQRLELARALVTEPTILVLDEATSALDAVTEQAVLDGVRRRGAACVVIAHRLSAIRDCDEIVVLAQGRIVERGDHASLLAAAGEYARLVEA